jgi:hypothetical protein
MGYEVSEIPYIGMAEKLLVGCADPALAVVRELVPGSAGRGSQPLGGEVRPSGTVRRLARYVRAENACSHCYANLVFALSRMGEGELAHIREPIAIGQGFEGRGGNIGIGRCTAGFTVNLPGCPPAGRDIIDFLRNLR